MILYVYTWLSTVILYIYTWLTTGRNIALWVFPILAGTNNALGAVRWSTDQADALSMDHKTARSVADRTSGFTTTDRREVR